MKRRVKKDITIVTFSDTHCQHKKLTTMLPNSDIIIFAGDCSGRGHLLDIKNFVEWYGQLPHKHKIMISGNHDWGFENNSDACEQLCKDNGVLYLNDTSVTVEGIKIHGSPVTPKFCNWAFNRSTTIEESMTPLSQMRGHSYIGNHWDKIPENADILVTHGPAEGLLDKTIWGDSTGCPVLLRHLMSKNNLKMHIFGHIHEARGVDIVTQNEGSTILLVNTSSLDEYYQCLEKPYFYFKWSNILKGKL